MPIHDYRCPACRHLEDDVVILGSEQVPDTIDCPRCGEQAQRLPACIARTASRWGDSHAQYIPALGGEIRNSMEFDRACEERSLAPVGPAEESRMQSNMDRERRAYQETQRVTRAIDERAAELGPEGDREARAVATSEILTPAYLEREERYGDTL